MYDRRAKLQKESRGHIVSFEQKDDYKERLKAYTDLLEKVDTWERYNIASKSIKKCRDRAIRDRERLPKDKYRFNKDKADSAVKTIERGRQVEGEHIGLPFYLLKWQKHDIVEEIFGWEMKITDNSGESRWIRRFNKVIAIIAKKEGKSSLTGGMGVAATFTEGKGKHGYIAATKLDQAKISYNYACKMFAHIKRPSGKPMFKKTERDGLVYDQGRGISATIKPLATSGDMQSNDGLNVSVGLIDEYHAHSTSAVMDILKQGTTANIESIIFIISTAGYNMGGPLYTQEREYAMKILDGVVEDERCFVYIAEPDEEWSKEEMLVNDCYLEDGSLNPASKWLQVKPSLGIVNQVVSMESLAKEAREKGGETQSNFLVKQMNKWSFSAEDYISIEKYNRKELSATEAHKLIDKNSKFVFGCDLSETNDLTSLTYTTNLSDGREFTQTMFYLPELRVEELSRKYQIPLYDYAEAGELTLTPGDVVDYDVVYRDLLAFPYDFECIVMDPHNARRLGIKLTEHFGENKVIFQAQSTVALNEWTKSMQVKLSQENGGLYHDGSKLLKWNFSNAKIYKDANNNIKIMKLDAKSRASKKVDGCYSTLMSSGRLGDILEERQKEVKVRFI